MLPNLWVKMTNFFPGKNQWLCQNKREATDIIRVKKKFLRINFIATSEIYCLIQFEIWSSIVLSSQYLKFLQKLITVYKFLFHHQKMLFSVAVAWASFHSEEIVMQIERMLSRDCKRANQTYSCKIFSPNIPIALLNLQ